MHISDALMFCYTFQAARWARCSACT